MRKRNALVSEKQHSVRIQNASLFSVFNSVSKLDSWLKEYGWKSPDPYDILGTSFFLSIQSLRVRSSFGEKILTPIVALPYLFPKLTRKIFQVRKTYNAMAAALLARGYLNLYGASADSSHLRLALNYLDWLEKHHSEGYSGICWGYPFDWQSKILIPKGTPSGVVTSIVVQTFLYAYKITEENKFKEIAVNAIDFFLKDLNIVFVDNDKLCFSYTPLDNFRVHNANLWVASTLAGIMACAKLKKYRKTVIKAVNFTLNDQGIDGRFYYWDTRYAQAEGIRNGLDNYHTGYVIESLIDISKLFNWGNELSVPINKALKFYQRNFVQDSVPTHIPTSIHSTIATYPIIVDINDCSEAILVFLKAYSNGFCSDGKQKGAKACMWTIRNMQDCSGYFYHRIYKWGVDKTPYVRWSQAWMFYALTELIKKYSEESSDFSYLTINKKPEKKEFLRSDCRLGDISL